MRLIDAEILEIEMIKAKSFGELSAKGAIRKVQHAPTVDAVPVVRCKDCKFWEQATEKSGRCIEALDTTAYSTDFCSYGERRTDETD